jgi:hypothetical protein
LWKKKIKGEGGMRSKIQSWEIMRVNVGRGLSADTNMSGTTRSEIWGEGCLFRPQELLHVNFVLRKEGARIGEEWERRGNGMKDFPAKS